MNPDVFFFMTLLVLIIILILLLLDPVALLRLPRLELRVYVEATEGKAIENILIEHTGGRPLRDVSFRTEMDICVNDEGRLKDITFEDEIVFPSIAAGERKRILILETDRFEPESKECFVTFTDGSKKRIEWRKNLYSGVLTCSSGKIKLERKIAIERTERNVYAHVFRF